uniref:Beta-1,4-galactosyltransferase n=1 Tax=Geotrypetes seraphini TaxID=260995 RepID=A0A6P8NUM5_GEOSA|nr:beta-1,4-galactosyltransferase 2 [Geotrypetes seraphini]XP_033772530.1 beta-1,4-galactosyltransferase 2 [Geotrypetes seraphini]
MSRLLLGVTLERICKAILLLCLIHFLILMILYFNVYAQHLDFFSRLGTKNSTRPHPYYNFSRPNGTAPSYTAPAGSTGELLPPSTGPESNQSISEKPLPPCPEDPPALVGPMLIEFKSAINLERVKKENPDVREGGKYIPSDCKAKQRVAIIIPFRYREHHLNYWLHYLHPILRRQRANYGIYIIIQNGDDTFNKGKLMNIGFLEALKEEPYDCFIFSDIDLVPMDDRNLYRCYNQPRHYITAMDKFGFRLPYVNYFGGVTGLSKAQFLKINGFSNEFWGWGGEDDDFYSRVTLTGMKVARPHIQIGKYRMIKHARDKHNEDNPQRFVKIRNTKMTMLKDGLNSLQYQVINKVKYPLYTNITVDVGKSPPMSAQG